MNTHRTDDVFGVSRGVPLNYTSRADVDTVFIESLSKQRHIVLHGSSKQGKTALRKECLASADYITVQCLSSWDLDALHAAILKEAGFDLTEGTSKTTNGKLKAAATVKAGISVPFLGSAGGQVSMGGGKNDSITVKKAPLELDLADVNDVIRALTSINFKGFIALEDFHYLPEETQKKFAVALKAFHERSPYCFIVIGVWLEHDRLSVYNGDLAGRVTSISVDRWSSADLHRVIEKGEQLLNIELDATFKEELVQNALESVYIVQDVCNRACIDCGIYETQRERTVVRPKESARDLIKSIVDKEAARYGTFLQRFADGFRDTQLQMYRWLLLPIIDAPIEQLEQGLRYRDIRECLQENHPEGRGLNLGNLTLSLQSVASLQVKHGIKPLILDYDQTSNRLTVVDRSFMVWLEHQDREELKEALEIVVGKQQD